MNVETVKFFAGLYIIGISFCSFLLGIAFLRDKIVFYEKMIVSGLFFSMGFMFFEHYYGNYYISANPSYFVTVTLSQMKYAKLIIAPLLYLLYRYETNIGIKFHFYHLLNFIPYAAVTLVNVFHSLNVFDIELITGRKIWNLFDTEATLFMIPYGLFVIIDILMSHFSKFNKSKIKPGYIIIFSLAGIFISIGFIFVEARILDMFSIIPITFIVLITFFTQMSNRKLKINLIDDIKNYNYYKKATGGVDDDLLDARLNDLMQNEKLFLYEELTSALKEYKYNNSVYIKKVISKIRTH
ncbi:MAG: hypothetical protein JXK07_04450, partial [Spirochaetes bacterium]|nr:hypothetical protein [Spirochaetota bacterium]MBN2772068.1 hypothetical protein [Spirochaetota bacterium]